MFAIRSPLAAGANIDRTLQLSSQRGAINVAKYLQWCKFIQHAAGIVAIDADKMQVATKTCLRL